MGKFMLTSLTLFFPCYNDRLAIGEVIRSADQAGREAAEDFEILVIDDGSTDGSRELLRELEKENPRLRAIFHERNQGYGAALQSGFSNASKDWVFYTDGDGQYDVLEMSRFLPRAAGGAKAVNGYKIRRQDSWFRKTLGLAYLNFTRLLFRYRVRDVNCDFRLIQRACLQGVHLHSKSGAAGLELVTKLERSGVTFINEPVTHYPRRHGKSQFIALRPLTQTFFDVCRLWKELNEK